MIKNSFLFTVLFVFLSCNVKKKPASIISNSSIKSNVNNVIDAWHKAAANANYEDYFNLMTKDGVFIGTDATENWKNKDFKAFSKPYFDKGKAWSFTPLERNVYISNDKNIIWFDELLDTQMKICRGSGVLKKENNRWKIAHYVLSITIPNDQVKTIVAMKKHNDSLLITKKSDKWLKGD